jgi:hypothetical protein
MRVNQENCIRTGSVTRILLVTISIAMTQPFGHAQATVASQEATSPSSNIARIGSGEALSTSIEQPSDHVTAGPCRLQVQDTFVQPPANPTEAKSTIGTMDYAPLSARCKFNLFLNQVHSPSTFVSAAFQATLDQAQDQWPEYGEESKVSASDLGRLWRTQNRGGSSRQLRYRRSCIRILDISLHTSEVLFRGRGTP